MAETIVTIIVTLMLIAALVGMMAIVIYGLNRTLFDDDNIYGHIKTRIIPPCYECKWYKEGINSLDPSRCVCPKALRCLSKLDARRVTFEKAKYVRGRYYCKFKKIGK